MGHGLVLLNSIIHAQSVPSCGGFADWLFGSMDSKPGFRVWYLLFEFDVSWLRALAFGDMGVHPLSCQFIVFDSWVHF
jgi:hypothetical protein